MSEDVYETPHYTHRIPRYYGDIVRGFFICAGALLLILTLLGARPLPFHLIVWVLVVLTIITFVSLIRPRAKAVLLLKAMVAGGVCFLFEYTAIEGVKGTESFFTTSFFIQQFFAVIFLTATLFATKTIREMSDIIKS